MEFHSLHVKFNVYFLALTDITVLQMSIASQRLTMSVADVWCINDDDRRVYLSLFEFLIFI